MVRAVSACRSSPRSKARVMVASAAICAAARISIEDQSAATKTYPGRATNRVRKLGSPSTGCASGMFCMFGLLQVLRPEIAPAIR